MRGPKTYTMEYDYCLSTVCLIEMKYFPHFYCSLIGFYIFDEMRGRLDESSYYGIPQRVDFDGIKKGTKELCTTQDQFREVTDCTPMTRVYYLQYQVNDSINLILST